MKKINEKLWHIILMLKRTQLGTRLVALIYASGIVRLWNHLLYECDRNKPTLEMKRSRRFFKQNKMRVHRVENLLEDEESKRVFRQCILYRITHDWRVRPKYSRRDQYFPKDIISLNPEEVFIDCGAYNGDTIQSFLKYSHKKYKRIVAFEPDKNNIELIKNGGGLRRVSVIPAACWSSDTVLLFEENNGSSSRVKQSQDHDSNTIELTAKAIDHVEECSDATFIKMDIEGSEYEALIGGYETIARNRPKLAICIYHSDEDMLRIAELIASWNLGYKFYVRHHAQLVAETVLYAII
ncbi:MAG: FkbM family methyltransferase [Lachnospiraceae bacterium]|jgi:FkbM family methyltransferase|nr:FkbM family methyltransferase [Lachnospiraceae bacterium]